MPFISLIVGAVLVIIDQIIKYFVSAYLQPVGSVSVIDNLFNLTYVENKGVAFGMFSDMRWVFVALTSVLLAIIIFYMFKKRPKGKFFYICAACVCFRINVNAFFVPLEGLHCFCFVAVYLPVAQKLEILPFMFNKTADVLRRIAKKKSDFMRKYAALVNTSAKTAYTFVYIAAAVSVLLQN